MGEAAGAAVGELVDVGGILTGAIVVGDATGEEVQSGSQASGQAALAITPSLLSHLHLMSGFRAT